MSAQTSYLIKRSDGLYVKSFTSDGWTYDLTNKETEAMPFQFMSTCVAVAICLGFGVDFQPELYRGQLDLWS